MSIRIVPDSNVIVSAFAIGGIPLRLIKSAIMQKCPLITCGAILQEVYAALNKPFFRNRIPPPDSPLRIVVAYGRMAVVHDPRDILPVCRDPDDDVVLACAVESRADVLVTGDKDLLCIGRYQGVEIIPPAQCAQRLDASLP